LAVCEDIHVNDSVKEDLGEQGGNMETLITATVRPSVRPRMKTLCTIALALLALALATVGCRQQHTVTDSGLGQGITCTNLNSQLTLCANTLGFSTTYTYQLANASGSKLLRITKAEYDGLIRCQACMDKNHDAFDAAVEAATMNTLPAVQQDRQNGEDRCKQQYRKEIGQPEGGR
jgi:hypothetical protein